MTDRPNRYGHAGRGFPDGRPPWVDATAFEIQPDHRKWPSYVRPETHRVWLDEEGGVFVVLRDEQRRLRRLQWKEQASDAPLTRAERAEMSRLISRLRAEGSR